MLRRRLGIIVTGVLLAGAVLTGAALAAGPAADKADRLQKAVESGKLTPEQAELHKQIHERRQYYFEQFQAERKAIIEQAVQDGKLTREQADRMLKPQVHQKRPGKMQKFHGLQGKMGMTEEQMKARLADAIQSGRITQEQADKLLEQWTAMKARAKAKTEAR